MGRNYLDTVIYQRGNRTADHPATGHHAYHQQDDDGAGGVGKCSSQSIFIVTPRHLVAYHRQKQTSTSCQQQANLTGPIQGIASKELAYQYQHSNKYGNWYHGNKWMRLSILRFLTFHVLRYDCKITTFLLHDKVSAKIKPHGIP